MQLGSEQPSPRHRSDQRAAYVEAVPHAATPGSHRLTDPGSTGPDRVVFSPDPGRFHRVAADRPGRDHGIGFRSSQEVVAEMSPVIYRPAGSGEPDRDPERPPRVSIAGPGVPTAASFANDEAAPPPPAAPPVDDLSDDLDEDPEIAEDELVDEAEDALLDELEEGAAADGRDLLDSELDGPGELDPSHDFDALDDPHFDARHEEPRASDTVAGVPAPPPAGSQQKRRRRLLGRHDDELVGPPAPEREPVREVGPAPEPLPAPVDEPVAQVADAPVAQVADAPVDEVADAPVDEADAKPVVRTRRRRVRTLHISAPPTGPATPTSFEVDPEFQVEPEPIEAPAAEAAVTAPDPRWRQAAPRLGAPTRAPDPEPEALDASAGQVEAPELEVEVEQLEEVEALVVTEAGSEAGSEPGAPAEEPASLDELEGDSRHRRATPAISGHVTSTRGRGLSGMTVTVVDAAGDVIDHAVTGRRGGFVVEDIAPGTYHLSAGDQVDGDFADAWFGGRTADEAEPLEVHDGLTTSGVDTALPARVVIDADVDVRRKKVVVDIAVTDRTSGLPGHGSVVLSTEHFSTELPLVKGRTTITLIGSTRDWDPGTTRLGKRLRVDYVGNRHTASQSRSIRLR